MGLLRITPDVAFADGVFAPGAKAYFYEPGTTTPTTVYSDSAETTAHASPLEAAAEGVFPQVFGPSDVKVVITESDDTSVATLETVYPIGETGAAASGISKSPVTGNSATNVEDAINNNVTRLNDLGTPSVAGVAMLEASTAAAQRTLLSLGQANVDIASITFSAGDMLYHNGSALVNIAKGTEGEVLKQGASNAPEWGNDPVKAWVNFDGTGTVSIRDSFNVSSITDNGTGDYTINFDTALVDANYAVASTNSKNSLGDQPAALNLFSLSNSSVRVKNRRTNDNSTLLDSNYITAAIIR